MKIQNLVLLSTFVLFVTALLLLPMILHEVNRITVQATDVPPVPTVPPYPTNVPSPPDGPTLPPEPTQTPQTTSTPIVTPEMTPTPPTSGTPQPTQSPNETIFPRPTVTPQVTDLPSGTSQPNPSSKHSSMRKSGPDCEDKNMEITFTVTDNNNPVGNVEVNFTYRGEQQSKVKTNNQGVARVSYIYREPGTIRGQADQDFGSQELYVDELLCDAQLAIGTGGEVLGSETSQLADTSAWPRGLELYALIGSLISMTGLGLQFLTVRR